MDFSEKLRNLRDNLEPKPSQTEVGLATGIEQRKMSRLENGRTEPNLQDIISLCKYYRVSADYLLGLPRNLTYPKR